MNSQHTAMVMPDVEKSRRINFLNPSVEMEIPTGNNSTSPTKLGVGLGGGYPGLYSKHCQ